MTDIPSEPPSSAKREERLQAAVQVIEERLQPLAILLYGSAASGRAGPRSDVDVAVLLGRPRPDWQTLGALRTDLEALLACDVDIAILDDASPIFLMEVIKNHRALCMRDPQAFEDLVVKALTDYFDLKRVRQPIEQALLAPRSA